jgi:hypothetical protein
MFICNTEKCVEKEVLVDYSTPTVFFKHHFCIHTIPFLYEEDAYYVNGL